VERGRVEVFVPKQELDNVKLKVNKTLAREYYTAFLSLRDELSLTDNIGIDLLASQRDLFMLDEVDIDLEDFYRALEAALDGLAKTRLDEGADLVLDINQRLELIRSYLSGIEQKRDEFITSSRERLYERLKEMLGDVQVDETRIVQEVAILIERSDITEEIVRLKSHLKHFTEVISTEDSVGKKLDFIVQELRREINTIGSKAQHFEIASNVVEVKHELEKIREQIQNLQ
ncbi:MAG: DUF1732 domain-containing protein, partial [Nitrospirota bacterium]